MREGAAQPVKHTGPRLYNLDTDIGELTDVAAQHPTIVARLQKLIARNGRRPGRERHRPRGAPPRPR